jgi:hypothetical protein
LTRTLGIDGAAIAVIGLDLLYAATAVTAAIRYFEYGSLHRWAARLGPPVDLLFAERDRLVRRLRRPAGE